MPSRLIPKLPEPSDHLKRVVGGMENFSAIAGRWHIFRHSFISLCAVSGVPKAQVQDWVGHLSDEITEHYTHLSKWQAYHAMHQVKF